MLWNEFCAHLGAKQTLQFPRFLNNLPRLELRFPVLVGYGCSECYCWFDTNCDIAAKRLHMLHPCLATHGGAVVGEPIALNSSAYRSHWIAEYNKLSIRQKSFVDDVVKQEGCSRNVFVTGPAGCGKSTAVKCLSKFLLMHYGIKAVAILAFTKVACNVINGSTIHSYFKLGTTNLNSESFCANAIVTAVLGSDHADDIKNYLRFMIIDECSMVGGRVLDAIDIALRCLKHNTKPFGGVKVVACGDMLQLNPVGSNVRKLFESAAFCGKSFRVYYLSTVYRQALDEFVQLLNKMRVGLLTTEDCEKMSTSYGKRVPLEFVMLMAQATGLLYCTQRDSPDSKIKTALLSKLSYHWPHSDRLTNPNRIEELNAFHTMSKLPLASSDYHMHSCFALGAENAEGDSVRAALAQYFASEAIPYGSSYCAPKVDVVITDQQCKMIANHKLAKSTVLNMLTNLAKDRVIEMQTSKQIPASLLLSPGRKIMFNDNPGYNPYLANNMMAEVISYCLHTDQLVVRPISNDPTLRYKEVVLERVPLKQAVSIGCNLADFTGYSPVTTNKRHWMNVQVLVHVYPISAAQYGNAYTVQGVTLHDLPTVFINERCSFTGGGYVLFSRFRDPSLIACLHWLLPEDFPVDKLSLAFDRFHSACEGNFYDVDYCCKRFYAGHNCDACGSK